MVSQCVFTKLQTTMSVVLNNLHQSPLGTFTLPSDMLSDVGLTKMNCFTIIFPRWSVENDELALHKVLGINRGLCCFRVIIMSAKLGFPSKHSQIMTHIYPRVHNELI